MVDRKIIAIEKAALIGDDDGTERNVAWRQQLTKYGWKSGHGTRSF